ncbi:hypothetical protein EDD22DRAFT_854244 [Suillus occidentalis]|nr:hypothetical protein EDD22DRAFT_854244 [Suillus occidentalis]
MFNSWDLHQSNTSPHQHYPPPNIHQHNNMDLSQYQQGQLWPMAPTSHCDQAAAGAAQYTQYDYHSGLYPGHATGFHHVPQCPPTTVAMPPDYGEAWQLPIPAMNLADPNAPPTQLSSDMFSGVVPPAPFPHAIDNEDVHSTIAHRCGGLPRERASRTAPFRHPTTTKRASSGRRRALHDDKTSLMVTFIPHNTLDFLEEYRKKIWVTIFSNSLLPSDDEIKSLANSVWTAVIQEQSDVSLIAWANAHDKEYWAAKYCPVILALITDVMKPVVEYSVYHRYNFDLDYTMILDDAHIAERGKQIEDLVDNDMFLYALLSVEGTDIMVPFAHPAIITPMIYLLRDSADKYHQYIRKDLNFKPLFAMTATLCLWALQERRMGRFVAHAFEADAKNIGHYMRYLSLLNTMPQNQLSALTQIFINCSAL